MQFIENYDILFFQETKTDIYDHLCLPKGYSYKAKHRKTCHKKSGGIIIIYKNYLSKFLEFPETESDYVQWVKIDKSLLQSDHNFIFGCIYVPPENTKYSSPEAFNEIESEMIDMVKEGDYIGFLGDYNAKTGTLLDYVETDKSLLDLFDLDEDVDLIKFMYDYENLTKAGIPLDRKNSCTGRPNAYGHRLLDFCRKNNIYIVNGRVGKDNMKGECTSGDISLIDYFLASSNLFPYIIDFEVKDFSPLFSDVHKRLHISLGMLKRDRTITESETPDDSIPTTRPRAWSEDKTENYIECFLSDSRFENINRFVDLLDEKHNNGEVITDDCVNKIVDDIGELFNDTAKSVFGIRKSPTNRDGPNSDNSQQTPWFNTACKDKREIFHTARKKYNVCKSDLNKARMNLASREYKKELNKAYDQFQNQMTGEIRSVSKSNPKKFWDILRRCTNSKKSDIDVPLKDLYEYFKEINRGDDTQLDFNPDEQNDINSEISDRILNGKITAAEIERVVRKLHSNKASGLDFITNEYLKHTLIIMLPVYTKLFNIIFETGIVPESWTTGNIHPIYKNKGNSMDPKNYRPISLVSCFSKVFTTIINNRLTSFSDEINLISEVQCGFRKSHSTVDNMFILNSFIDLYLHKKNKLFCTFIDFSKAFDKVNRSGLWSKMIKSNIQGKCFNIIKNMYQNIKSCVTKGGINSDFFACELGVRQGENLSPFLFAIFMNDLESYFENHYADSLHIVDDLFFEHLNIFMKVFLLLYADDTLLFSETLDGMQNTLNIFDDYCKLWKLEVNTEKTKVVVFSKRKFRPDVKLKLNGKELDYTDTYSYLGILFQYNGSFNAAKKKLVEQSQKALYAVYYKIRNLRLPIDLQLKIFDSLVSPILLYGSEVLGIGKNDNIEKVHLQFMKKILGVRITTPNFLVYGELGRYPLYINIKIRMLCFWSRLLVTNKLSSKIYKLLYSLYIDGQYQSAFVKNIANIFDDTGLSFIFNSQMPVNPIWIKNYVKQIFIDQFIQKWRSDIANSSRGHFYSLFKQDFCLEPYLLRLQYNYRCYITKFRLSNFKIPIETGRWLNIAKEDRKCPKCLNNDIGDEFHYLFICTNPEISNLRIKYIPDYYIKYSSVEKMAGIFALCHVDLLKNVSFFLKSLSKLFV